MARKCFEVKTIEFRFNYDVLDEQIVQIEEKFLSKAICGFKTKSRSYARRGQDYTSIKFEFTGKDCIPMGDVIKIFEDWAEVIHIDYTVNLQNMVITLAI